MNILLNPFHALCAITLLAAAPHGVLAQGSQPQVRWEIEVVQDGQSVDRFGATTTVGQAKSDTHKRSVVHDVGCQNKPAASLELSRSITVSPTRIDNGNAVLSIDVQETLEDSRNAQTWEGCTLPPQPRKIAASHPGLVVPAGQTVPWELIDRSPKLVYRVQASVAGH
jgi:hypothetical protein